jgi:hypothetical protein
VKEKPGDLVQHLLSRARESLEEAKILADAMRVIMARFSYLKKPMLIPGSRKSNFS